MKYDTDLNSITTNFVGYAIQLTRMTTHTVTPIPHKLDVSASLLHVFPNVMCGFNPVVPMKGT